MHANLGISHIFEDKWEIYRFGRKKRFAQEAPKQKKNDQEIHNKKSLKKTCKKDEQKICAKEKNAHNVLLDSLAFAQDGKENAASDES